MDTFNFIMPPSTEINTIQSAPQKNVEGGEGINLADIILEKIAAHEAVQSGQPVIHGGGGLEEAVELPAKVVEVYSK